MVEMNIYPPRIFRLVGYGLATIKVAERSFSLQGMLVLAYEASAIVRELLHDNSCARCILCIADKCSSLLQINATASYVNEMKYWYPEVGPTGMWRDPGLDTRTWCNVQDSCSGTT